MPSTGILGGAEVSHSVLVMLAKWFSLPRLETRTKESNICASSWVGKLTDIMQASAGMLALATDQLTVKGSS